MLRHNAHEIHRVEPCDILYNLGPVESVLHVEEKRHLAEQQVHIDQCNRFTRICFRYRSCKVDCHGRRADASFAAENTDDTPLLALFLPSFENSLSLLFTEFQKRLPDLVASCRLMKKFLCGGPHC